MAIVSEVFIVSIPITLVTGFLGAGKSTLINRVLEGNPDVRFGLVVNEFGDVKLESQIIEAGAADAVTELSNGCMCCIVRSDLVTTVEGLLAKAPDIGHIILEASGLSDPVPIANTFLNEDLGGRVHFDAIICVVDAVNFLSSLDSYNVAEVQLGYSDYILLSKADLATPEQLAETKKIILAMRPDARILEIGEDFPMDLVFDTSNVDHSELAGLEIEEHRHHHGADDDDDDDDHDHDDDDHDHDDDDHDHEHEHEDGAADGHKLYHHAHESVDTLFYKSSRPLDLDRFGDLLHDMPREVIRAKGFLLFSDRKASKAKYILQMVGPRPVLDAKPWARGESRMSALVFIGRGFDKKDLLEKLKACEVA